MLAEGMMAGDPAILPHLDDFARLDLADEFRADDIKRHAFAGEDRGIADLAHHQRADPQRIAAGDHPLGGHADERIGPLDQPQRIDEAVEQRRVAAGGDQVDDHLGIAGRLEDRTLVDQFVAQPGGVRDIAVVGDGKTAARQVGEQGLDIAQARAAGG